MCPHPKSFCVFLLLISNMCSQLTELCPMECTCERLVYNEDGRMTNCSYIRPPSLVEVLRRIPNNTAELLVRSCELSSITLVTSSIKLQLKSYISLLDLSGNHLKQILSSDLENFTEVITLYLSDNHIAHLDESVFSNNPKLLALHLDGNNLTTIRRNFLSAILKLEYLSLSRNNIAHIEDDAFKDLGSLRLLNLSYNDMSELVVKPSFLIGLTSIATLILNHCNILTINLLAFQNLGKLQYLYIENNRLSEIPVNAIKTLTELKALYLSDNLITNVPAELSTLSPIKFLYLSRNRICSVHPEALGGLERLEELWLDNNKLKYLPKELEYDFYQLSFQKINLYHNPWRCDCKLIWLVKWIQNQRRRPVLKSPQCHWTSPILGVPSVRYKMHLMDICDMRCPMHEDCSIQNEGECFFCPRFMEYDVHSRTCRCLPGYYKNSTNNCLACPSGTFRLNQEKCLQCPEGSFTFTKGSAMCACLPGRTYLGNGYCELCPRNTYKSRIGIYSCLDCPPFSQSAPGSDEAANCTCIVHDDMSQKSRHRPFCPKPSNNHVTLYNSSVRLVHTITSTTTSFESDTTQGQVLGAIAAILCCAVLLVIIAIYLRRRRNRYLGMEVQTRSIKSYKLGSSDDSRFCDNLTVSVEEQSTLCDIRIKKIRLGRLIGRGAFGQVHEGFAYCDSSSDVKMLRVAVKRLKTNSLCDEKQALKQEYEQMRLLGHHCNIIGLVGWCNLNGQMAIILEYADLGNLLSYLKDKSSMLENYVSISPEGNIAEEEKHSITDEKELMVFAWQIARGMAYVHQQKCIHRDLAARNILIAGGPVAKISDFGLSRDVYENGYYFRASKGQLPYKWLSPEALLWGQYSTKSDVWSFGILLWEITTLGGSPYPGIPVDQIAELHRSGYRLSQPPSCPNNFFQILKACWEEDPRKRPSFTKLCEALDEVLQTVFINDYLDMRSASRPSYIETGDREDFLLSLTDLADKSKLDGFRVKRETLTSSGYSSSITSYT